MPDRVAAPRHFVPTPALAGAGLPHDRAARLAARRAFVVLKTGFVAALHGIDDERTAWLRHQVRAAEEPTDLWLLRAPAFAVLTGNGIDHRQRRNALRRSLETLFPDSEPPTGFGPF